MQTRLPEGTGIRELQRICNSEPNKFEGLIIHLVRDPRAVLSSAVGLKFFLPFGPKRKLVRLKIHHTREKKSLETMHVSYAP